VAVLFTAAVELLLHHVYRLDPPAPNKRLDTLTSGTLGFWAIDPARGATGLERAYEIDGGSSINDPTRRNSQVDPGSAYVKASVLVPVLNEEAFLRRTVPAMQAQDLDGEIEFIFIDGQSRDGSRELLEAMARKDPRIRVIDNPAQQTAKALNLGLQASRGEYLVRMDAHTFYPNHYIAAGVERLRRGDVAWVCGAQVATGEGVWSRRVALALNHPLGTGASRRFGRGGEIPDETELDTGVFTGVWRRATVEAHGGWDDGWPVNQDSELAARVLAAGGQIVSIPALDAWYVPRNSPKALARQYLRYGFYRAKTTRRHPATMRYGHLFPPGLVVAGLAALVAPRALARPARAALLVYALALAATSAARDAPTSDKLTLPAVFATMHTAWGLGFLGGCVRFAASAGEGPTGRDRASDPGVQGRVPSVSR